MIEVKAEYPLPYQQQGGVCRPELRTERLQVRSCFIIFQMNNCNSFCFNGVNDSDGWSPGPCWGLGSTKDFSWKIDHFSINLFSKSILEEGRGDKLNIKPYTVYQFVAYQFLEFCVRSDFTQHAMITLNHVKVMVPRMGNKFTRGIWQRNRILL